MGMNFLVALMVEAPAVVGVFFFCLGNVTLRDCGIDRISTVDLWTTELRGEVLSLKTWKRCKELLWKPPKHQAKLWAVATARGFGVDAAVAQILTVFSQWDQQRRLCMGTVQHTDTLNPAACVCLCFNWTWTNWTAFFFFIKSHWIFTSQFKYNPSQTLLYHAVRACHRLSGCCQSNVPDHFNRISQNLSQLLPLCAAATIDRCACACACVCEVRRRQLPVQWVYCNTDNCFME